MLSQASSPRTPPTIQINVILSTSFEQLKYNALPNKSCFQLVSTNWHRMCQLIPSDGFLGSLAIVLVFWAWLAWPCLVPAVLIGLALVMGMGVLIWSYRTGRSVLYARVATGLFVGLLLTDMSLLIGTSLDDANTLWSAPAWTVAAMAVLMVVMHCLMLSTSPPGVGFYACICCYIRDHSIPIVQQPQSHQHLYEPITESSEPVTERSQLTLITFQTDLS